MVSADVFKASIILDVIWDIILFSLWCWRIDVARLSNSSGPLNGAIVIYTMLMMACGARIAFAYLIAKSITRARLFGYIVPTVISIILYISMMGALSDISGFDAELPVGLIGMCMNIGYLGIGFLVYKDNGFQQTSVGYSSR